MTLDRIEAQFARRAELARETQLADAASPPKSTSLVAYITVGYRSVEESYACARAALDGGADMLELGVPFSDPSADGPVISRASYEAIAQGGSLRRALEVAARLRETHEQPIILFTYYNPVVAFGEAKLPEEAARVGVDGLLVVDLPPEEGAELRSAAKQHRLAIIPLLAPTSGAEREAAICEGASGFIYYVSVTGVTGSGVAPLEEAGRQATRIQQASGLPVAVGFGIDSPEKARQAAAAGARAVVVGTAIVKRIGESAPDQSAEVVRQFVSELRQGLDG